MNIGMLFFIICISAYIANKYLNKSTKRTYYFLYEEAKNLNIQDHFQRELEYLSTIYPRRTDKHLIHKAFERAIYLGKMDGTYEEKSNKIEN